MLQKLTSRAVTAGVAAIGVTMVGAVIFVASRNDETRVVSAAQADQGSGTGETPTVTADPQMPLTEPTVTIESPAETDRRSPDAATAEQTSTAPATTERSAATTAGGEANAAPTTNPGDELRSTSALGANSAISTAAPENTATSQNTTSQATSPQTTATSTPQSTSTAPPGTSTSQTTAPSTPSTSTSQSTSTSAPSTSTSQTTPTQPGPAEVPDPLTTAIASGAYAMAPGASTTVILAKGSASPTVSGPLLLIPISSLVDTGDERWELRAVGEGTGLVVARTVEGSTSWTIESVTPES